MWLCFVAPAGSQHLSRLIPFAAMLARVYAECNKLLWVTLEETPRGERASDALGAFLFLEKMDGRQERKRVEGPMSQSAWPGQTPFYVPRASPPVINYWAGSVSPYQVDASLSAFEAGFGRKLGRSFCSINKERNLISDHS